MKQKDENQTATTVQPEKPTRQRPGKPFTPGHDARRNIGGRPRIPAEIHELMRAKGAEVRLLAMEHAEELMQTVLRIARDRKHPSLALSAALAGLDRALGKPEATITAAVTAVAGDEDSFTALERARRIAYLLERGVKAIDETPTITHALPETPQ